jgi:hypothetical protein
MFTKIKAVVVGELKKGLSPEKLSQSLIGGFCIGVFPFLGTTTLLSFIFGWFFKLNQVILQTVNYLVYPLQFLMIPVYIKVVSLIFPVGDVPVNPLVMLEMFNNDWRHFFSLYLEIGLLAVVVWSVGTICLFLLFYPLLVFLIKKMKLN